MGTEKFDNQILEVMNGRQGQALMVTLMVMFALVFLGSLFITIMVRNIGSTRRSGEVATADYVAEAGVRFASDQLTYGNQLADWRPIPEYPAFMQFVVAPLMNAGASDADLQAAGTAVEQAVQAGTLSSISGYPFTMLNSTQLGSLQSSGLTAQQLPITYNPNQEPPILYNDPDLAYLYEGYCRFNYGSGRFLLRVSYEPNQTAQYRSSSRSNLSVGPVLSTRLTLPR